MRAFWHGLRWIAKRPVASLVSALGLAVGITGCAIAWTLVDAALLRPFGLVGSDRLVVIWETDPSRGHDLIEVSHLNFLDWQREARTLDFWRARFAQSADVIGQMLFVDGDGHRIIGVIPRGFGYPTTLMPGFQWNAPWVKRLPACPKNNSGTSVCLKCSGAGAPVSATRGFATSSRRLSAIWPPGTRRQPRT